MPTKSDTQMVSVRLPKDLVARLDAVAEQDLRSRSSLIQKVLVDHLDQQGATDQAA